MTRPLPPLGRLAYRMNVAEPSREQAAEIVTFGHALQFAFPIEDITAPNTMAASALEVFDQEPTSSLSDIASMDEDEIKQEIANWKFNGDRPSIKWRARLSQAVKPHGLPLAWLGVLKIHNTLSSTFVTTHSRLLEPSRPPPCLLQPARSSLRRTLMR